MWKKFGGASGWKISMFGVFFCKILLIVIIILILRICMRKLMIWVCLRNCWLNISKLNKIFVNCKIKL